MREQVDHDRLEKPPSGACIVGDHHCSAFVQVEVPKGYHSGGASYVLSRESLRRFHEAHQDPQSSCRKDGGSEDVEVARCLRSRGVYPGKSVDEQNRELFHPLPFIDHFRGSIPDWLDSYAENAPQSVSVTSPIVFHIASVFIGCQLLR